jgi:hypothetical protein
MSATILQPDSVRKAAGIVEVIVTIPTTVDSSSGATCIVTFNGPVIKITGTAVSSNFNSKALSMKASNDGVNFYALATAISVTQSGNFVVDSGVSKDDIGFRYYQLLFSGAPAATLVVTLAGTLLY